MKRTTSTASKTKNVRAKPPRKRDLARHQLIEKIATHPKVTKRTAERRLLLLELQLGKRRRKRRKIEPSRLVHCYAWVSAIQPRRRKVSKHEVQVPMSTVLKALGKEYEARLTET